MMSRAAIYQLFRRIPDADDASIDAAVDALADQGAAKADLKVLEEKVATKADIAELRASLRLVHWIIGILAALHLSTLWILFGIVDRLSALETTVRSLAQALG